MEDLDLLHLLDPGNHWKHRIVTTASALDLFSVLGPGPRTAPQVAAALGGDARALAVLLNALAAMGLVHKTDDGHFFNSQVAQRYLVRGTPEYRGDQLVFDDACWHLWGNLGKTLVTGAPPLKGSVFVSDPESAERLLMGLHQDALRIAPALAQSLPLAACSSLLDLGGGVGSYSIIFCRRHPALRATIFELPATARLARAMVREWGMDQRINVMEGDFLVDPIPGVYDAVFMSNVLHGNSAADNGALLKKAGAALPPGGLLIVRDLIMEEDLVRPETAAVFSVNMLLHSREGRCYSLGEIEQWLRDAEFSAVTVVEPNCVVLATKQRGEDRRRG